MHLTNFFIINRIVKEKLSVHETDMRIALNKFVHTKYKSKRKAQCTWNWLGALHVTNLFILNTKEKEKLNVHLTDREHCT